MTDTGSASGISQRLQYFSLIGLSTVLTVFTALVYRAPCQVFAPYLGNFNPLVSFLVMAFISVGLLAVLRSRAGFLIYAGKPAGLFVAAGMAVFLAGLMILVDLSVHFPQDLNVAFPLSVGFYPVIGYIVEVVFHLVPLAGVLLLLTSVLKHPRQQVRLIWLSIAAVALLEPIYQTAGFIGFYPTWTVILVAVHIYGFNLLQLTFFRRYDFITMYTFRLVYYLLWHIVWGYVRLKWLF